MKTKKTLFKRIKITKNKKLITRLGGQDHFRAKKSGKKIRLTHRTKNLSKSTRKILRKLLG